MHSDVWQEEKNIIINLLFLLIRFVWIRFCDLELYQHHHRDDKQHRVHLYVCR